MNVFSPSRALERVLRHRAEISYRAIRPDLEGSRILDVGAAEGWVGEAIQRDAPDREVHLLDVVDLNRTALPHRMYDGRKFPFESDSFDTVLVMLTLHHCEDPDIVLREASRVARRRVIVTESTYRHTIGRRLLWLMDTAVNSARSKRLMPEAIHFRRADAWLAAFRTAGLRARERRLLSRGPHRHELFVLDRVA